MAKTVVLTHGVFDLMHSNHIAALREAKEFGTHLIVGVEADALTQSHKRTPVLDQDERLKQVQAVRYVDEAHIVDQPWSPKVLEGYLDAYEVDAYVYNGVGWEDLYKPAMDRGIFHRLPYHEGISTSKIIERILSNKANWLRKDG